ncbi:antibiotic biosynthesis monooxygenase [Pseudanabaena biceps]|nr:antibiotic biosynthesis monooxygenase [Pseudanabaena biceps]
MTNSWENPSNPTEPITLVISEVIEPNMMEEYEEWTKGINQAAQQFEGFIGVQVIRPRDHHNPEYVVIVKFENYSYCKSWLASPIYEHWMQSSKKFVSKRSQQQLPTGLELWFTLPTTNPSNLGQPAYYKQVIIGVITVYPLILVANFTLTPLLQGLPFLISLLISVTFVSALLSYPVMPYVTKVLGFWLYPSASKRRRKR